MDLDKIRMQIDSIDSDILKLFEKRMDCAKEVAKFKSENNLPIFQKDREISLLNNIKEKANENYEDSAVALFSTLINISKSLQKSEIGEPSDIIQNLKKISENKFSIPKYPTVGYFGIKGTFCYNAALKRFPESKICNYTNFSDVFKAVENRQVDFGILPIDNSTAGSINPVYSLLRKNNLFINETLTLKIEHCLAVRPGTSIKDIKDVISHSQAISQCDVFLENQGLKGRHYESTAGAAEFVANSKDRCIAAICSEKTAKEYGLEVLMSNIQNSNENYTKFIIISKHLYLDSSQDTVSISLSLPHLSGSLYSLLTKFVVAGVNLTKIQSQPIGNKNFDVVFYLDFSGNLENPGTLNLLNELSEELSDFKFLGCFKEGIIQ